MPNEVVITIRPAIVGDADAIAETFIESAEYHASLDPERYSVPAVETISARYREATQRPPEAEGDSVTLVAEAGGEVVGFVDAQLEKSPDLMHRDMVYCQVKEIAVSRRHRNQGIGGQLLRAVEDWGRRQGAEFAVLEYLASNTTAGRFYQQHMGYSVGSITTIRRL